MSQSEARRRIDIMQSFLDTSGEAEKAGGGIRVLSYAIQKDHGIVLLDAVGRISIDDYQKIAPHFLSEIKSRNIRRILMDWRRFDGWGSDSAPSIGFHAWQDIRPLCDRIALVIHDGIRNEADSFDAFFRNAGTDIRRFRSDQYDAALDWLTAENGASPA